MSKSPTLFSSDDEDEGLCLEAKMLKKFQIMLQGVPPPSSVTMSKLSVNDMLERYNKNENLYGIKSVESNKSCIFSYKNHSTPLVFYANSSRISEEIANLLQKVQFRYIYSETMSSCNIWFDSAIKTNSAKKHSGKRKNFGLSPGSRLSHLARRRQIFSCENLQQLANSDKHRHIEIKKQSALKTRILEKNKTVEPDKSNSYKRALFLSPDEEDSCNENHSLKTCDKSNHNNSRSTGISSNIINQYHMKGSSKKRRRIESKDANGSWPRRALTFTEEEPDKNQETNLRNAKVISEVQLSLHHKSKLLWAVSVTLKEKNITSKHPEFKTCASALFMICRKNLGKILSSKKNVGTSEKMLHFAREQIGGIFKKLGISLDYNARQENSNCSSVGSNLDVDDKNAQEEIGISENSFLCLKNVSNTVNGESPMRVQTNEVQTNIVEKENIELSEKTESFP